MIIDDFRPVKKTGKSETQPAASPPSAEAPTPTPATVETQPAPAALTSSPLPPAHAPEQPLRANTLPKHELNTPDKERKHRMKLTKKQWLIIAGVVILIGGGFGVWELTHPHKPPVSIKSSTKKVLSTVATPTTVPSDLDGLPVAPAINKLPVTAVMIENSTFARPQSGLGAAGIVFEALAEGGITRFMALYQDTAPTNIGPIRSVRPYYEQWALGFDAAIAHVGGSPDALADITSWGVRNLDEFYNGSSYHRITTREAPHNVYTGIPTLNQLEASKGYTTSIYTSFPRKADQPSKVPNAVTINMTLSSSTYNVSYAYNPKTNSYNRSEGGQPQVDANTGAQISPKVVIAMIIPESNGALDSSDAYYSDYQDIGSGAVYVFQDGTVTIGTWAKSGNTAQITFTGANGKPIKLNTGQTWLTAVVSAGDVTYSP